MSAVKFDHTGIGKFILGGSLQVPINQREYSWEDVHTEAMCKDFADAIGADKDSYFMGTVVLTRKGSSLEVVDGQQRLATATMMLAAMRDIFCASGDDRLVRSIEDDYLFRIDPDSEQELPKLILNVKDRDFFLDKVLRKPDHPDRKIKKKKNIKKYPSSNKKIIRAAKVIRSFLDDRIKSLKPSTKKDELKRWMKFIRERAMVIVLTVPDEQNAYVMFETLNDRGLKVSKADLVKNYLFGIAGDRISEAQGRWASMISILEMVGDEDAAIDYLRSVCTVLAGLTREKEVFTTIKARASSQHAALVFSETLEDYAGDYAAMLMPDHQKWNDYPENTRRAIVTLNLFDVTQIRHLMLAVAHHFSTRECERAYRLFVNWIVRLFIAGAGRVGRVESIYADFAHEIYKEDGIKTAKELSDRMARHLASDDEFRQAFANASVSKVKLARYYLDSMERQQTGDSECDLVPNDSSAVVNVEHVMPFNPGEGWDGIDSETVDEYVNRLGNQVLLNAKKNSKLGKRSFKSKKPSLATCPFKLTKLATTVASGNSWGPPEITKRQSKLAEIAVKTWPLKIR